MPKDKCVHCRIQIDPKDFELRGNYCAECNSEFEDKKYDNYLGKHKKPTVPNGFARHQFIRESIK